MTSARRPASGSDIVSDHVFKELQDVGADDWVMIRRALARVQAETRGLRALDELAIVQGLLAARAEIAPVADFFDAPSCLPPLFKDYPGSTVWRLPPPSEPGGTIAEVLRRRATSYAHDARPLPLPALSALLLHGYGIREYTQAYGIDRFPMRMAPSAGGLQPVNLYVVANLVGELPAGVYYFHAEAAELREVKSGDYRDQLVDVCMGQTMVRSAQAVAVLTCSLDRVMWRYGLRHYRTVHVDAGAVMQNLYLVGCARGLSICAVGGFFDAAANELVGVDGRAEFVVLFVAIGSAGDTTDSATIEVSPSPQRQR